MTKGQQQLVSVVIIIVIALGTIVLVLPWTLSMVQKKKDMKTLDDVYNFFQKLDETIRYVEKHKGEESLILKTPGKFTIDPHDGAVGVWHFNENDGNVTHDETLNGNDGSLENQTGSCGGTACPSWTAGKFGSALEFDGIGDYVHVPYDPSLGVTDEITIEAWVKCTSPVLPINAIVGRQWWGPYILWIQNSQVCFRIGSNGIDLYNTTCSIITISADTWYHVVGVAKSNDYMKIYINGEQKGELSPIVSMIDDPSINIGLGSGTDGGAYFFNGIIDEVAIYNRALSPEEIYNHFKHGISINSIRFSFLSKVSNVAEGYWVPLNTPNTYDIGTLGIDPASVIFAEAEKVGNEIEVNYKLWYRELDDQSGHGYRIILNTTDDIPKSTTTGFLRLQWLNSREIQQDGKTLTVTEINTLV